MRILHTSDWHLGKRLFDRERLPEQEKALGFLAELCEERKVDLVLVAGDVFDTFLPSAEAEELFFSAVKKLAGERRAVVIVSGNHDDGIRLASSAPLAESDGVYIFGGRAFRADVSGNRPVRAAASGENYIVIENADGEKVYINVLPYPNEARLKEEKTEESYPDRVARWIGKGDECFKGGPHILLTHLFVQGGQVSDSERSIELGGARAVPLSVFPRDCYVALGHLHKRQSMGNAHYCGSLLQYSFDEKPDKTVYLLETDKDEVKIAEKIPVEGGKRLIRLEANGPEEGAELLKKYGEDVWIELTLHLTKPLVREDLAMLKEANSGLVHTVTDVEVSDGDTPLMRSRMSDEELFSEYYRSRFASEPDDALKAAFLSLLAEGE